MTRPCDESCWCSPSLWIFLLFEFPLLPLLPSLSELNRCQCSRLLFSYHLKGPGYPGGCPRFLLRTAIYLVDCSCFDCCYAVFLNWSLPTSTFSAPGTCHQQMGFVLFCRGWCLGLATSRCRAALQRHNSIQFVLFSA